MSAVTGEDFEKLGIQISPLDSKDNRQGASYDFRIGDQIWLWSARKMFYPEKEEVILKRHDIAIVKTYETIKMPADTCGIIVNQVAPHAIGIFHPGTTIDPLFDGNMHIALINLGRFDISLKWKKDLCTAMFFKSTSETKIHYKRSQDFSELIEVFAKHLGIMYPERQEKIPESVSLQELEKEITWRGSPYLYLYRFLAEHDNSLLALNKRLNDLHSAVKGYQFAFIMAFPWVVTVVTFGVLINQLSLDWQKIVPIAGILGGISAIVNLSILAYRWLRGRRLK